VDLLTLALLAGGVAVLRKGPTIPPKPPMPEVLSFIRSAAIKHKVSPVVALAFADIESGLNPRAEGDLGWAARKGGSLYRKHVLNNPRLAQNPALHDTSAWHSYGLYQLMAAHHVGAKEHPTELLDARVNADRGVAFIAKLMTRAQGDTRRARLAYVGCGIDGQLCNQEDVDKISARLREALAKWEAKGVG
jgi:hypothetical protein